MCPVRAALTSACRRGRVDAIVQSTDKNFMVPVGGAVLSAPAGQGRGWLVSAVAQAYPGRAAMTPLLDLLTTLLYWGKAGWQDKLRQREGLYVYLRCVLQLYYSSTAGAWLYVRQQQQGGGRACACVVGVTCMYSGGLVHCFQYVQVAVGGCTCTSRCIQLYCSCTAGACSACGWSVGERGYMCASGVTCVHTT